MESPIKLNDLNLVTYLKGTWVFCCFCKNPVMINVDMVIGKNTGIACDSCCAEDSEV